MGAAHPSGDCGQPPYGGVCQDLEGRKILANKVDLQNMGMASEEEVLGKTDFDMFPRHIAESFWQDDSQVLKSGEAVIDREELLAESNGEQRWQSTSKLPLRDETGKIVGLVGFGQDITVEKTLPRKMPEYRRVSESSRRWWRR